MPAPTTASFFGTLSRSSAPQLSMMFLPSNFRAGNSTGMDRGRQHDVFCLSVSFLPSCAVYSTVRPVSSLPWPCSAVTPALFSSIAMPPVLALTMPVLRFCICVTSNSTPLTLMP